MFERRAGKDDSVVRPPLQKLIEANDVEFNIKAFEHHVHREDLLPQFSIRPSRKETTAGTERAAYIFAK